MYCNNLNKNLIIYKSNKLLYKFLIVISLNLGWFLYPLKINKNKHLNEILLGYNKIYKFFFKIKGFGYKWKKFLHLNKYKQNIFLKLSFTHRIVILTSKNLKMKLKKRRLIIKHRSYNFLRNNLKFLFFLYKTYLYNKKGIYVRGTKYKLKLSKKKSKF